jgi:gliding motility-associated-like protein
MWNFKCSNISITVNDPENASFSLSSNTQCQNGTNITANITGVSGGTFTSTPAGLNLNASTGAINVGASTPNTYTVTYTTSGTCPGTANTTVTINATQSSAFTLSAPTACQNGTDITPNITGATGGVFSSSPVGLSIDSGTGLIDVSSSSANSYTVTYTSPGPCASSSDIAVTINQADDATFSYSGGTFCLTGTNPAATINGTTGGTFTINNGGVIDASTGEIDLVGSGVNSYTVTYTTSGVCPDSETFALQITSAPDADFSYTGTPYCEGSGTATVTFAPGASGGVFSSTAGLVINSGTGAIDLNTSTPGIYTVENNIAASGGCAAANAITSIEIIGQDDAAFSYSGTTFCLSGTNPVANITGTTGGIFTINNGGTIDASTGEIDLVASGIDPFTVTYSTGGTCPDIATFDVQITSAPDATFSYAGTPYCEGSGSASVSFAPGASGGVFSSTAGLVINSGTGEIDLNTSTPGIYSVENNIVASGGCAPANASTSIEIIAQDDASFTYASATFCENETNPIASISGTAGGIFTSSPAGLSINASTGAIDLTASTLNATYVVTYTTTGTCPDDQDFTITLNESPIAPTVTSDATGNTICEGESLEIDASGSGMGITYNVYDAVTGGNLVGTTPLTVSPTVDTDYFVEAVNSNSCGNVGGLQTISITVNSLPSVDAGNDETICPGDNVTLTATGTGSVIWSTSETTASITVAPSSDETYTVTLTDANNCSNSDDVTVSVVNIGSSLVAVDDNYSVTTEVSTNFDVTSNDTYSGTSISIIDNPTSGIASENIDGTIDYISNAGFVGTDVLTYAICDVFCVNICDTATVTITVNRENDFGVPGGFSPNGDNINDIFVINGLDAYPNNNLTIFNRWGSMVFEANPYNNDWDGSPNVGGVLTGDKVTTGTYFYILDLGNDTEPLRGSIEVKRD